MFIICMANGQGEELYVSSENNISLTTLPCIAISTLTLVLLTLLCVCRKKSLNLEPELKETLAVVDENTLSNAQLQPTAEDKTQLKAHADSEPASENDDRGNVMAPEATAAAAAVHVPVEMEVTPNHACPPSPYLPPRNPHPKCSAQLSAAAKSPSSVANIDISKSHVAVSAMKSASNAGLVEGAKAKAEAAGMFNHEYEEVEFQKIPQPNENTKTAFADREYDYIDLRNQSTSARESHTSAAADCGGPSYAEVNIQAISSQKPPSETSDIPRYAKVDKTKNRHTFSPNLLQSALIAGAAANETTRTLVKSGSHDSLYTEVNKPPMAAVNGGNVVSCTRDFHSERDGDDSTEEVQQPRDQIYSMIKDDQDDLLNTDPDYSSIYDTQSRNARPEAQNVQSLTENKKAENSCDCTSPENNVYESVDYDALTFRENSESGRQ